MMQGNTNWDDVETAFYSMTAEAAQKGRDFVLTLAELYPKPMTLELVKPLRAGKFDQQLTMLKTLGELSPIGLSLINWNTKVIEWRNNSYANVFRATFGKESQAGVKIGDLVPEFNGLGLAAMFDRVAATGEPLQLTEFPFPTPDGLTYWNASIAALPSTEEDTYLFLQLQRVDRPAQTLAA